MNAQICYPTMNLNKAMNLNEFWCVNFNAQKHQDCGGEISENTNFI